MKTRITRVLLAGTVLAATAFGGVSLASSRSTLGFIPITPLCGPSFLWSCSKIGGPEFLFGGTVCEKIIFERRTGTTCVPFGG